MQGKHTSMRSVATGAALSGGLALCALLLPATGVAAPMVPATSGSITYVCGGVGADEQQALQADAPHYGMSLLFTEGRRGEYLSDVAVKVRRNGKDVAEFRAEGPRCLMKGPQGSYRSAPSTTVWKSTPCWPRA